jgi:hypothetical protein
MKTFLEKLILHINAITHSSGSWLPQKAENEPKSKVELVISIKNAISPDCVAMRSPSKKQQQIRRTPAP